MAETEVQETIEISIDKEGPAQIFQKKKWKVKWAVVSGGGIYYKNKKKGSGLEGPLVFKNGIITPCEEEKKKFVLKIKGESEFLIAFDDDKERKQWKEAMEANLDKDPGAGKGKKVKQSRAMRMKKNISGTMATSSAGKGLIKEFMGKDGVRLLDIVKTVITLHEGKKKAAEIENNIIKVAVKVILLWKNKDITTKDIVGTIPGVKAVWSDVIDFCEMSFAYDPTKVKKHGAELAEAFTKLLEKYITEKNIQLMQQTIQYCVTESLLNVMFQDEKQDELKQELTEILRSAWIKVFKHDRQ